MSDEVEALEPELDDLERETKDYVDWGVRHTWESRESMDSPEEDKHTFKWMKRRKHKKQGKKAETQDEHRPPRYLPNDVHIQVKEFDQNLKDFFKLQEKPRPLKLRIEKTKGGVGLAAPVLH